MPRTQTHHHLGPLLAQRLDYAPCLYTCIGFHMRNTFCLSPVVLAILTTSPSIHAEEKDVLLDDIVISGAKEETSLRKTPIAIGKINAQTFDEKKPTFVGQVLNQTPGVYITDLGNGQHMTSIRYPMTTSAVYQYLEDGIPIRPVGLFNHNAMYEINLDGVGGVEVIKGPASSLYGSNAAGGAVNFMTKPASSTPQAILGYQRSDQGYQKYDFGVSGSTDTQGFRATGFVSDRTGGWQQHNNANRTGLTLRHDALLTDETALKTIVSHTHLFTQMPGSVNADDYANRPEFSYNTFTWRKVDATRLSTALEGSWNQGGLSTITGYVRDNTTDQLPSYLIFRSNPASNCGDGSALFEFCGRTTHMQFNSLGLDLRHRQDVLDNTLRMLFGMNIESTHAQANERNLGVTRDSNGVYTQYAALNTRRDYTVDVSSQALYSQLEFSPQPMLHVVLGGRYDHIEYDFHNKLTPSNSTGAPSEQRAYSRFSPKLGAIWNMASNLDGYANASRGFAPPEISSLYGGSLQTPSLKPATYDNLDVGLRYTSADKKQTGELGVYRLNGKNEFVSFSTAPGNSIPTNAGSTVHQGIEFGVSHKETDWDARLNGTYARHRYSAYQASSTVDASGMWMQKAPKWLVNAELGVKPMAQLRFSAEVQYLGPYAMNLLNTVHYPGHTLLHLRASYKWKSTELWAALMNATHEKYAEDASSTYALGTYSPVNQDTYSVGAPRTFLLGLRYTFGGK